MAVAHTRQPNNASFTKVSNIFDTTVEYVRLFVVTCISRKYWAIIWLLPIPGLRGGGCAEIQRPSHQGLVLVNGVFESSNMAWILYVLCVSCMFCALCMSWLLVVRCLMGRTSAGPFSPLLIFSLLGSVTWHILFLSYLLLGCPRTGWEMANWWLIPDWDVAVWGGGSGNVVDNVNSKGWWIAIWCSIYVSNTCRKVLHPCWWQYIYL